MTTALPWLFPLDVPETSLAFHAGTGSSLPTTNVTGFKKIYHNWLRKDLLEVFFRGTKNNTRLYFVESSLVTIIKQ